MTEPAPVPEEPAHPMPFGVKKVEPKPEPTPEPPKDPPTDP